MKEKVLWKFIAKRLKQGQTVMLLIVVESSGSSPGRPGFKMAVDSDGALCGSIGGGIMEMKLVELAKNQLLQNREEMLVKRQVHRKSAERDRSGMICSGEQTVLLATLKTEDIREIRRLLRCLETGRTAVLQISAARPEGNSNQTLAVLRVLENRQNESPYHYETGGDQDFLFEENIGYKNQLFIIGGGHCALALSELMYRMDFFIRLYDDRPELSTMRKNRFVHKKYILESYETLDGIIPSGKDVYVVVMTLGYRSDEIVIRRLCDKSFRYFGVLGSAVKMAVLLENLRQAGFPAEKLDKIRTPIGLSINSRTPEEIAVSIAAEIIAVKNGAAAGDG